LYVIRIFKLKIKIDKLKATPFILGMWREYLRNINKGRELIVRVLLPHPPYTLELEKQLSIVHQIINVSNQLSQEGFQGDGKSVSNLKKWLLNNYLYECIDKANCYVCAR
jgi:hypothetical protein